MGACASVFKGGTLILDARWDVQNAWRVREARYAYWNRMEAEAIGEAAAAEEESEDADHEEEEEEEVAIVEASVEEQLQLCEEN